MWESIKNDPILKAITIIILGILGFGFAFNIMFGQRPGNSMDGGEMASGGYSFESTLSYILVIAFKLLLIALVIVSLIAIFKLAGKYLFKGGETKMINSIKNDPVLKTLSIIVLAVLALGLIFMLFGGITGNGMYGNGMMGGNGTMNGNYGGYNAMGNAAVGISLTGLLAVLIKMLLFVSVVGLIVGLAMYLYNNYSKTIVQKLQTLKTSQLSNSTCSNCNTNISGDFIFCPACGAKTKHECVSCGAELKAEWKCCPNCGAEKETIETKSA